MVELMASMMAEWMVASMEVNRADKMVEKKVKQMAAMMEVTMVEKKDA